MAGESTSTLAASVTLARKSSAAATVGIHATPSGSTSMARAT
jgi:hypothetical protein